jgi:hypothetical protein
MYFGATYEFQCDRRIPDIQAAWNALGPYTWKAFDNDQYGVYIVTREPEKNLRIRVLGERPNYSLEMDCNVPMDQIEVVMAALLSTMLDRLLPSVRATAVRDTSRETM